jgi:hypothetical protein
LTAIKFVTKIGERERDLALNDHILTYVHINLKNSLLRLCVCEILHPRVHIPHP